MNKDTCVLVIGARNGIIKVLQNKQIPFALWQEKPVLKGRDALKVLSRPFPRNQDKIRELLLENFSFTQFSHVIAGTEGAVFPAALARRVLNARLSPKTTALRCHDKLFMKDYLAEHQIPMTKYLDSSKIQNYNEIFSLLGKPLVCKERKSSGSKGIKFISNEADLLPELKQKKILEKFVKGSEASIESFIAGSEIQFTNITQYYQNGLVNFVPAAFEPDTLRAIKDLNQKVIKALKIKWGITHLEVYLTETGPIFGEIAMRPPGGYIMPAMEEAYGFNPWEALVAIELAEPFTFQGTVENYTGVAVFHPGEGIVTNIQGETFIKNHPAVREFQLKVKTGEKIETRSSLGKDVAHIIFSAKTPEERLNLYKELQNNFFIEVI